MSSQKSFGIRTVASFFFFSSSNSFDAAFFRCLDVFLSSILCNTEIKYKIFFYVFRREDEAAETSPTAVLTTRMAAPGVEARGEAERQTIRKRKSRVRLMNLDYFVPH